MIFDIHQAPPTQADILREIKILESKLPGEQKTLRIISAILLIGGMVITAVCYYNIPYLLNDDFAIYLITPAVTTFHVVFLSLLLFKKNAFRYCGIGIPLGVSVAIALHPSVNFTPESILALLFNTYLCVPIIFFTFKELADPTYITTNELELLSSDLIDREIIALSEYLVVPEVTKYVHAVASQGRKITRAEYKMLTDQYRTLFEKSKVDNAKALVYGQQLRPESNFHRE